MVRLRSRPGRRQRLRKNLCGGVATLAWLASAIAVADAVVPLPRPRPAGAPAAQTKETPAVSDKTGSDAGKTPSAAPPEADAAKPPEPSACRLGLTEDIAIAPSLPPIRGPGACGGEDIVRLEAVVLPDARRVPLKPAATMRCTMAARVADWVRSDLAPIAARLKTAVGELDNFDSFDCRGRNRVAGARLSEHGRANALDVRGIKLANGQTIALTERTTPREVRESVLQSVCARFTTVLGPGSDGYHEDHVHLDLAERRGGYRLCQWHIWDDWPKIAPLMPAARPDDAPPREIANKDARPVPHSSREAEPAQVDDGDDAQAASPSAGPPPAANTTTKVKTRGRAKTAGASATTAGSGGAASRSKAPKKRGAGQPAPLQILRPSLPR